MPIRSDSDRGLPFTLLDLPVIRSNQMTFSIVFAVIWIALAVAFIIPEKRLAHAHPRIPG
jgi:hypothetical protein